MPMERVLIQLPRPLKRKLEGLRRRGFTVSGFIRSVLEKELAHTPAPKKDAR